MPLLISDIDRADYNASVSDANMEPSTESNVAYGELRPDYDYLTNPLATTNDPSPTTTENPAYGSVTKVTEDYYVEITEDLMHDKDRLSWSS